MAIAFVAIAMVSGGIVSSYEMNKGSVEVRGAAQAEVAGTVQPENEKMEQAGIKSAVQADKMTFSCGVAGCTQTGEHSHGEESHGGNSGGHHQSGHGGGHH